MTPSWPISCPLFWGAPFMVKIPGAGLGGTFTFLYLQTAGRVTMHGQEMLNRRILRKVSKPVISFGISWPLYNLFEYKLMKFTKHGFKMTRFFDYYVKSMCTLRPIDGLATKVLHHWLKRHKIKWKLIKFKTYFGWSLCAFDFFGCGCVLGFSFRHFHLKLNGFPLRYNYLDELRTMFSLASNYSRLTAPKNCCTAIGRERCVAQRWLVK